MNYKTTDDYSGVTILTDAKGSTVKGGDVD